MRERVDVDAGGGNAADRDGRAVDEIGSRQSEKGAALRRARRRRRREREPLGKLGGPASRIGRGGRDAGAGLGDPDDPEVDDADAAGVGRDLSGAEVGLAF